MLNFLLSIDIMGGTSAPPTMENQIVSQGTDSSPIMTAIFISFIVGFLVGYAVRHYMKNASTTEDDQEQGPVLKHLATADSTTISKFYSSGSTINLVNGKLVIDVNEGALCGFRWDLSKINIKPNTKYLIKFHNISVAGITNHSFQLKTQWQDSTYIFLRYYHTKEKQFDIISSETEVSNDYYQTFTSNTYDLYEMEFEFLHNGIENSNLKTLYFDFTGITKRLSIDEISIYEIAYE